MSGQVIEKYQLAGVDERERGFSRPVELQQEDALYRATLRYEKVEIAGESGEGKEAALFELIRHLQARGYTQLRSQLTFLGTQYLGSQEPWVEYPDPDRPTEEPAEIGGFFKRVGGFFRR